MRLTRWQNGALPSFEALKTALGNQGYRVSEWTDIPGTVYPVHLHETAEARWVVRGRLRVGLPDHGEEITLEAGDRLELEPNETYWADVEGELPVMYLIGIKNGHLK
jgi:quercetin dioxygenase-like cupin family protein